MPLIPPVDDMFPIGEDMIVHLGKDSTQLNLIILSPKTEKRASREEVSLSTILASRLDNRREVLEEALAHYKNSTFQKQVKLKVEVFNVDSGRLLGSAISLPISDTASKAHGAMDMRDATPLVSCSRGGRKVVMVSEFPLARDVHPRFQLYDRNGSRLKELEEEILNQPGSNGQRAVEVLKETIMFITPSQAHAERILREGWQIQLTARRGSDGLVSKKKFLFQFLPHDYYNPCIFCDLAVDHQTPGDVTLSHNALQCHTIHCNVTQCIAMSHNALQCHTVTQVLSHLLLHVFNHGLDCAREKCREQKTAERWKPPEQIQGKEATLWKWCGSRAGQKLTQKIRPVKLPLKTRDLAFQTFCK